MNQRIDLAVVGATEAPAWMVNRGWGAKPDRVLVAGVLWSTGSSWRATLPFGEPRHRCFWRAAAITFRPTPERIGARGSESEGR